jgi:hypothetical protein
MTVRKLGIVMYGVTGRMGLNQHLARSIVAIREQGGVALPNGDRVMPDPILVGRNAEKVAALARQYKIERSTTDLDAALNNPGDTAFFDASITQMRADLLIRAIEAGKHIYCEKPVADSLDDLYRTFQHSVIDLVAPHGHSAVYDDLCSRNEACFVGNEEQRCIGSVTAVTHEADRDALESRFEQRFHVATGALPGKPCFYHRRVQLPGDDGVYANALVRILHSHDA